MIKYNSLTKETVMVKGDTGFLAIELDTSGINYEQKDTDTIEWVVVDKETKEAVVTKTATDGSNVIAFNPEDTENLPKNSYKYYARFVTETGAKYTFSFGEFTLIDVGGRT